MPVTLADVRSTHGGHTEPFFDAHPTASVGLFSLETVELSFEPGDITATLTIPTENETLNDGNNYVKATIPLGESYGFDDDDSRLAVVWVRDDDIPTVTVTPATQVHLEGGSG